MSMRYSHMLCIFEKTNAYCHTQSHMHLKWGSETTGIRQCVSKYISIYMQYMVVVFEQNFSIIQISATLN